MKTIVIIAHPDFLNSETQAFLTTAAKKINVDFEILENNFDVKKQKDILDEYERIIFQFPLYWYFIPAILKKWFDEVLDNQKLKGKQFGCVVSTGVLEKNFSAGRKEGYTISELLRPLQAVARHFKMDFLPIFVISQFEYKNDIEKMNLFINYQDYLANGGRNSFLEEEEYLIKRLKSLNDASLDILIEEFESKKDDLKQLEEQLRLIKYDE